MASMGSFPAGVDSSILLHSANHQRPMIPGPAYRSRKYVVVGGIADCNSVGVSSTLDLFSRVSLCSGCGGGRRRWKTSRVKATAEETGGETGGDDSDEALQATIEKSKKVIQTQRELLQQVFVSLDLFHFSNSPFIFMLSHKTRMRLLYCGFMYISCELFDKIIQSSKRALQKNHTLFLIYSSYASCLRF